MEKADKEKFMSEIWKKYNATKDVEFLAKACEEAAETHQTTGPPRLQSYARNAQSDASCWPKGGRGSQGRPCVEPGRP